MEKSRVKSHSIFYYMGINETPSSSSAEIEKNDYALQLTREKTAREVASNHKEERKKAIEEAHPALHEARLQVLQHLRTCDSSIPPGITSIADAMHAISKIHGALFAINVLNTSIVQCVNEDMRSILENMADSFRWFLEKTSNTRESLSIVSMSEGEREGEEAGLAA